MPLYLLIFFFIIFSNCFASESLPSCKTTLAEELHALPTMTLELFDRTPGKGWRVLETAKCYPQAEDLLKRYIAMHGPQSSLYLHLGQIQLRQENRIAAADSFQKSLRQGEKTTDSFKFNDFVSALTAYAERDRARFDKHINVVKAGIDNYGNRQNMRLLNALADNFEANYNDVLSILEKIPVSP